MSSSPIWPIDAMSPDLGLLVFERQAELFEMFEMDRRVGVADEMDRPSVDESVLDLFDYVTRHYDDDKLWLDHGGITRAMRDEVRAKMVEVGYVKPLDEKAMTNEPRARRIAFRRRGVDYELDCDWKGAR